LLCKQGKYIYYSSNKYWVKNYNIELYKKKIFLEPKIIVGENGRKVRIYIVNNSNSYNSNSSYNSDYLIRFYSPDSDSDSDLKELVY
jgi:hypothetical protein